MIQELNHNLNHTAHEVTQSFIGLNGAHCYSCSETALIKGGMSKIYLFCTAFISDVQDMRSYVVVVSLVRFFAAKEMDRKIHMKNLINHKRNLELC